MTMEWQDISTAPKDGTEVLLFTVYVENDTNLCESFCCCQIGHWEDERLCGLTGTLFEAGWDTPKIGDPSHWMPLPPPPKA